MPRRSDPVLTIAQMQAAERALNGQGVDEWQLMQRAGRGAADYVWRISGGRSVTVLCGPGNNGGDGYVIAECLRQRGSAVTVIAPIDPASESARRARSQWQGTVATAADEISGEVFVDALFGSGLSRAVTGELARTVAALHGSHEKRIAIDVPSGVYADSGEYPNGPLRYDMTIALGAWKRAHFYGSAVASIGSTRLVDIGVRSDIAGGYLAQPPRLSPPDATAHKYSRGLAGIVGGEMTGAGLLAALAAQGAGAGYVKLFADHSHPGAPPDLVVVERGLPNAIGDGRIDALAIGTGLGRGEKARRRLSTVLGAARERDRLALVLDADALHCLREGDLDIESAVLRILLTPHEGELAKLCDTFGVTAEGKLDRASALASATGCNIIAKGADTILCRPDGPVSFFRSGPSWLSTAGTGDVLAGICASRIATGLDAAAAAEQAVHLHHEAARIAGPGFSAADLAAAVPRAYARFL